MSWTAKRETYEAVARSITPSVILVEKRGVAWVILAWVRCIFSFGLSKPKEWLEDTANALGPIQAYPSAWGVLDREVVVHESIHTLQCERCGWAVPILGWFFGRKVRAWVGFPVFLITNLLPLPSGLAYCKYRWELEAESRAWERALDEGWMGPKEVWRRAELFSVAMWSVGYLWAWPFAKRAAKARAAAIIKGTEK